MTLASPSLLLALLALPLLWWLLRATPPAPRTQDFPAVRLLLGIERREETPDRTPWPLLLLRLGAASLAVAGLAGPTFGSAPGPGAHGRGTRAPKRDVILVVDDGWASAHDWTRRMAAAERVLADASEDGVDASLLTTARDESDAPPALSAAMPARLLRTRLAALRPLPWPVDRADAARALALARRGAALGGARVVYIADGVGTRDDPAFIAALRAFPSLRTLRDGDTITRLLLPARSDANALDTTLVSVGDAARARTTDHLLVLDGAGGALGRVAFGTARDAGDGVEARTASVRLPLELRNQLARLVVEGTHAAATTVLLDDSDRRRPVGLLSGDPGSDTPLLGSLYYVERALPPGTTIRTGTLAALLARPLSVLVIADGTLADAAAHARVLAWVRHGGTLVRFAGPRLAASVDASDETGGGAAPAASDLTAPPGGNTSVPPGGDTSAPPGGDTTAASDEDDPLLAVPLLPGTRALGGAMSWGKPQHLAPFDRASPFAGLPVPSEVTVTRQVLARPSVDLSRRSWATLTDGTPVVTARRLGAGRVVLFHVTANADWSNLPLSGLFVEMLGRLSRLAAGVASPGDTTLLTPVSTLDAFGIAGTPPDAASGVAADAFGATVASPRHPPGIYGAGGERRALNLADALPPLAPEADPTPPLPLGSPGHVLALGPWLLGLSLLLLAIDLAVTLRLGGLLRARAAAAAVLLLAAAAATSPPAAPARAAVLPRATAAGTSGEAPAQTLAKTPAATAAAPATASVPQAALQTALAYVVTGNQEVDRISREGLAALSDTVNARTAATLGTPEGVVPGRDDLSFYPLLYWPILPDATADPRAAASLDSYMRTGGILLIDTQGGDADAPGSGAGFAPGANAALRRATTGLDVPPLARLAPTDVLAHTFYLLRDFPGRFDGAPVWVQRGGDPSNDGVSPVIIGGNDWAGAWAVGPDGQHELAAIPGGEDQRTLSLRFGVNVVMYALTGNYKGDQVHVPAILQRLGEGNPAPEEGE